MTAKLCLGKRPFCLRWFNCFIYVCTMGYPRTNVIGSRTSFVTKSVRSSIHWIYTYDYVLGNPFQVPILEQSYLLAPWCRVLLEKLTSLQLFKKFPAFHGTRMFITALTSFRQLFLSWARPIQSIYPHPISWRSILILSTHLRLGLPGGLLPSGFPTKTLYTPFSSPIRATCPAHLILLDFITRTILGEQYKPFSSSLCSLLHSAVTSSLLGPNILLNTMFSNTLSFLSSRNVSDQFSHPYKTTGKIIVLYILIFKFLDSNLEEQSYHTKFLT